MNLKEDDIVLCKVKRIEGTTVFLEIEGNGEGTMIFSEVSPGRIRNIRDFITVNKIVVCKVLRIKDGHPQLSLRRVTTKEREELMEVSKKEKMLENMLKPILKDKTQSALEKIKKSSELSDFLDEARENPELLKSISSGEDLEKLKKIFTDKRESEKEASITLTLRTDSSTGLLDIQKTLSLENVNAEIHYLGSSKFSVLVKAKTYKDANQLLEKALDEIKNNAKRTKIKLEVKGK